MAIDLEKIPTPELKARLHIRRLVAALIEDGQGQLDVVTDAQAFLENDYGTQ